MTLNVTIFAYLFEITAIV